MSFSFSAVLLAGGKSTRMGRDKALLEIDGLPLWRRQLSILQELEPQELFISGATRDEWREYIVVSDMQMNIGPLAGLISALHRSSTPLLVALAVDLPSMSSPYLRALLDSCSKQSGVIPRRANRFEPLAAIYPVASLPLAESCLQSGDYSLQRFAARCAAEGLVRPGNILARDERLFLNLNTPDDLLAATAT